MPVPIDDDRRVTTVQFGAPVHDHGLYEWNVLELSLREIICAHRVNSTGFPESTIRGPGDQ